jgi:hypothetical protein
MGPWVTASSRRYIVGSVKGGMRWRGVAQVVSNFFPASVWPVDVLECLYREVCSHLLLFVFRILQPKSTERHPQRYFDVTWDQLPTTNQTC